MATMSAGSPGIYDAIVVGVGGMGSAACYHLARRGLRTLGLERFDIPHTMGSSHGITRIIRLAYYEHPSYVPLLLRAFELWDELERESGRHLLEVTGTIDASGPDEIVFTGALASCEQFGLAHEVLTSAELTARYPGYQLPPDHLALFQPRGGFLLPERCISAHVEGALAAGADIRARERVTRLGTAGRRCTRHHRPRRLRGGESRARGRRLDGLAGSRARRVWPSRSGRCWAGSRPCSRRSSPRSGFRCSTSWFRRGDITASRNTTCQGSRSVSTIISRSGSTRTISSARRARSTKHRCARPPHATFRRRTARPWPCAPACSPIPRTSISSSTCCRTIPRSWSPRRAPGTASSSPR